MGGTPDGSTGNKGDRGGMNGSKGGSGGMADREAVRHHPNRMED